MRCQMCGSKDCCGGDLSEKIDRMEIEKSELIEVAEAVIEAERKQTAIKVPTVVWDKLKDVNTVGDLINALKAAEKEE